MSAGEMTDEEIDAAVAGEVMGDSYAARRGVATRTDGFRSQVWSPSTDIAAAFEVAERMRERGYRVNLYLPPRPGKDPSCYIGSRESGPFVAHAGTVQRAICEAALAAARSKSWWHSEPQP